MKTRFVLALFSLAVALFFGEAQANSLLSSPNPNPGQKFPLQGDCAQHGINPAKIDLTVSTWACAGASDQMMRIFYSDGPQACVYIDNFNRDEGALRAFFVPLRTSDEWIAFASNLPGGVRLRYGCQGQLLQDSCGNAFGLPDMPASDDPEDVIHITTPGGYAGDFVCRLTLEEGEVEGANPNRKPSIMGGCGAWKAVKETGSCVPAVAPPAPPVPEIPSPPPGL